MEPLTKIKIFLIIFSSLLIAIPIAIEIAVLSGLLSILNALFILVLSAIALAVSASSIYYRRLYEGELLEILLSPEFLDEVLSILLFQSIMLFPFFSSMKAGSPFEVIFLAPLGFIGYLILSSKFPLGLFTRIEPLDYPVPYKVYVAKLERIKEANAFVSGIIKPRIILLSPLFEFLNDDEIKGVIAHEIGHIEHKDHLKILVMLLISIIGIELLALSFYYEFVAGDEFSSLFLTLGLILTLLFGPPLSYYWRRVELKADLYAARTVGKDAYISALRKLYEHDLLPLDWGSEDHPKLEKRIEYILSNVE
jgi:STE24 endopeptidase